MCHSWIRPLWLKNKLAILEDALCWLKNTNILTMGTSKLSVLTSTSGTIASFSLWEGVRSWSSLKKVSVLALKCHFWIWPPPGLNLDLNLTPSLIHFHFSTLKRGASRKAGRAIFQTALRSDTSRASVCLNNVTTDSSSNVSADTLCKVDVAHFMFLPLLSLAVMH